MSLAILFWFYRDAAVCRNRLRTLRSLNPGIPVYGLYGGPLDQRREFEALDLDDFWAYDGPLSGVDAWRSGEMMIHRWHLQRGRLLAWDSLFVAQWDLLMTRPIEQLFTIPRDVLVLSALRPIHQVEEWWPWTCGENRREYLDFLAHVQATRSYSGEPWCCLFIIACFPRTFLDQFVEVARPELGFLEYKLPTYARAFGTPMVDAGMACWWAADPATAGAPASARLLNAVGFDVQLRVVVTHRSRGAFHPFRRVLPSGSWSTANAIAMELISDVVHSGKAAMRSAASAVRVRAEVG